MTVARTNADEILVAPLRRVRELLVLRSGILVVLAGISAMLAGLLMARLLAWLGHPPTDATIGAALSGLLFALGTGWAFWRRRPTTRRLALQMDKATGLDYRYATAVDVALDGEEPAPLVARVLVAEAEAEARALRPRSLVSFATPAVLAGCAAVLLLGAAVALLPSAGGAPAPDEAAAADAAPNDEALVETLEAVAQAIAEDAEERDDPYLRAVANALRERVTRAREAAGDPTLPEDAAALLDHAAAAYGTHRPDWLGEDGPSRLAGLQARLDEFEAAKARAAANPAIAQRATAENLDDYGQSPGDRERAIRSNEPALGMAESPAGGPEGPAGDEMAGGPPSGIRRMDFSAPAPGAAVPIGAALQSGRGPSNAAGRGSQTLEPDDAFMSISADGQTMVVTAKPGETGNRIRIELAPEASELVDSGVAGRLSASLASEGEPGEREFVPAYRRAVVARYFARNTQ